MLFERGGHAGAARHGRQAGSAQQADGSAPIFLGDAVHAHEPRRPPAAERGETGCETYGRIVRVHEVRPRLADGSAYGVRGCGNPPWPALDEWHRQGSGLQFRGPRSGRGGDEDIVARRAGAAVGGEKHLLGPAGAELLDHVEDAHSSS